MNNKLVLHWKNNQSVDYTESFKPATRNQQLRYKVINQLADQFELYHERLVEMIMLENSVNPNKQFNSNMKILSIGLFTWFLVSCASKKETPQSSLPSLTVLEVQSGNAVSYRDYPAAIEGATNVEIRPQVDGILEKIYADEGSFVVKGQPLFNIDEAPFLERLNQAEAQMHAADMVRRSEPDSMLVFAKCAW